MTSYQRLPVANFNGSDDMRAYAAHQMHLDPIMLTPWNAILEIEPPHESARAEA
jgi:hypothetical protein